MMMQSTLSILGLSFQRYGSILALGLLSSLAVYLFKGGKKARLSSFLFVSAVGLLLSRIFFCLFDPNFIEIFSFKNMLNLSLGGLSMLGGVSGVIFACFVLYKRGDKAAFNDAVFPLLVFIVFARLAENGTGLGLSRPLSESLGESAFILKEEWGSFIRVWMIEGMAAGALLVIMGLLYSKKPKNSSFALKFIMLFGASQIIMESLKYDGHMRFSFIAVQQILALLLLLLPILIMSLKLLSSRENKVLGLIGILMIIIIPSAGLLIEFAIDRSEISKLVLYMAYIALLVLPLADGFMLTRRIFDGKRKDCENK